MTKKSLRDLYLRFVSIVDKGDNKGAKILLTKSKEKKTEKKGGVQMKKLEDILKGMEEEDVKVINDKIEGLEKDKGDLETKFGDLKKANSELSGKIVELEKTDPTGDPSDEELIKSADPKIQKMLKDKKEVEDENAELKKEKDEEVAKVRKAELSKEAETYPNLGAPVEDIVDILSAIDGDEKTSGLVKGIFGAVNTALEGTQLLKSVGKSGDPEEKPAQEELQEKAEAMVEKDGISIELAKTRIMKTDPDKYMK